MSRGWIALVLAWCMWCVPASAQSESRISPKPIRDGVRAAVSGQLAALRDQNFTVAYEYAARGIKRQFDERVFALMIRRGYPALLRHEEADIGIVRDNGEGQAQVVVTVTDALKRATVYRFWVVEETAGWRIAGVVLEQKPPRGDI